MVPVGGRPFLDYLLTWLGAQGVTRVVLCVGYKRSYIQRYVRAGSKWGLEVDYSVEKRLLGTGGALRKAARLVSSDRMIVLNGDTFLDVNLSGLVDFHSSRNATVTLTVAKVSKSDRYGSVQLDANGKITAFLEKSQTKAPGSPRGRKNAINGGIYIFEKTMLNGIPARTPVSLERQVFPLLISERNIYGFSTDAYFLDIGVPEDLKRATIELPKRFHVCNTR